MSSLIEKATQRLEQLRNAGAVMPDSLLSAGISNQLESNLQPAKVENFKERVDSVAEGESSLPVTSTVSRRVELDFEVLSAAGIVSPNSPRTQIADQYRVIKRPLIRNAMGRGAARIDNGNLIMVTSSLPGEGKSFTAINLAMSIATELDNTVMLVDADVARPSVLRVLGLPPGPGLLDLIVDESLDLSSVLLKTNVDKLTILPSGTKHDRATELLASESMSRLLENMANRYSDRIIIFDSPPLLLTTESRVLATHMGQIVMVVHAAKTLQADVRAALGTIEACPVKMLVLNQSRSTSLASGGYGYGYGYGEEQVNA